MKCIQNLSNNEIKRVSDAWASELVYSNKWKFIKRSLWKAEVRDLKLVAAPTIIHTAESLEKEINNQHKSDARKQKREYQKSRRNYRVGQ